MKASLIFHCSCLRYFYLLYDSQRRVQISTNEIYLNRYFKNFTPPHAMMYIKMNIKYIFILEIFINASLRSSPLFKCFQHSFCKQPTKDFYLYQNVTLALFWKNHRNRKKVYLNTHFRRRLIFCPPQARPKHDL